jgi:hypothetical protein
MTPRELEIIVEVDSTVFITTDIKNEVGPKEA